MSYFNQYPDNPIIRNCERTGWPDGKEPVYPTCPVCNRQGAAHIILDKNHNILGCNDCLHTQENDDETALCPICGQPCETFYIDPDNNNILGCDVCTKQRDMWDCPDCFPEQNF